MKSIEKKIAEIRVRIKRLHEISSEIKSFDQYRSSLNNKDIVERNLQVTIEACLDICKIIISHQNLPEPADNKGVFVVLAETGIIGHESLQFLVPMAGIRNVLVHGYDKLEDSIIYGVLKRHLNDFDFFLKEIKKNYIEKLDEKK